MDPARSEPDEALMVEVRRLLVSVDQVPAHTRLAARMAFDLLPHATPAPQALLDRRPRRTARIACAQMRRARRARPLRRRARRRRPHP